MDGGEGGECEVWIGKCTGGGANDGTGGAIAWVGGDGGDRGKLRRLVLVGTPRCSVGVANRVQGVGRACSCRGPRRRGVGGSRRSDVVVGSR